MSDLWNLPISDFYGFTCFEITETRFKYLWKNSVSVSMYHVNFKCVIALAKKTSKDFLFNYILIKIYSDEILLHTSKKMPQFAEFYDGFSGKEISGYRA